MAQKILKFVAVRTAVLISSIVFASSLCLAEDFKAANDSQFWNNVLQGLDWGQYYISRSDTLLKSEVVLLKVNPKLLPLTVALASTYGKDRMSIKALVEASQGVAGINANFFDISGKPLGVLIQNGTASQNIHRGGKLLTGVFFLDRNGAHIVERSAFHQKNVKHAVQSGPRLIVRGKAVTLNSAPVHSRRSGIGITKTGEVILWATRLRFPGASLQEIQQMLQNKQIDVSDALNLDGGSSSQLYVPATGQLQQALEISGGEPVPVGLVVNKRK